MAHPLPERARVIKKLNIETLTSTDQGGVLRNLFPVAVEDFACLG